MGLFKRNKIWWINVTHNRRQIRRSTGTTDKRVAEAILAKVTIKILEGRFFDGAEERDRTFGEMMDRYMKEHAILKAPKSRIRDGSALTHLLPVFADNRLVNISPKHLATYKTNRRVEGAAPATINKELQLVRHAYNLAIREWEWCRDNPMSKVSLEQVHNQVDRWLTPLEEQRLLAAAPGWLRELIIFALHTGMRRGEILSLRWEDVDFSRRTLVVMKSKNRDRRTIPLNTTVMELLTSKKTESRYSEGLVFQSSSGTKIEEGNLSHAFNRARRRAELKDFRFHDLRHTFATRLVQRNEDLYKVQRLLGHKTGLMTQRYAHHSPESLRDSVEKLDPIHPETFSTNLAHGGVSASGKKC